MLFEPPFGGLRVIYALHLRLIRKLVVNFLFIIFEFFHYLLWLGCYKQKSVEVSIYQKGVGHFQRKFQVEGGVTHKPLLV